MLCAVSQGKRDCELSEERRLPGENKSNFLEKNLMQSKQKTKMQVKPKWLFLTSSKVYGFDQ
jgi:hypothetical protein